MDISSISKAITNPEELSKEIFDGDSPRKTYGIKIILNLVFGIYFASFCYKNTLFGIGRDSFLKPIEGFLQYLGLLLLGTIFFKLWQGIEKIALNIGYKTELTKEQRGNLILASFFPIVFLFPLYGILRLIYNNQYIKYDLGYIPIITITILFLWHYYLIYQFLILGKSKQTENTAEPSIKNVALSLGLMISIMALGLCWFFLVLPTWVGYTPYDLLLEVF